MRASVSRWGKTIVVALAILVPSAVVFGFLSIQVTSQPRFCGSCHYMSPYYESWKTSSHKEVLCVECHIPPGIPSEIRKKYEALAMVARYFTGTYSTNPWAEVDDQSCLRSGCHIKRVSLGKELYRGVLFDHQPHLTELRREKRLRCTSCHSQIVQGSHIAVTASTCFLCHFKNNALNQGTARCTVCHEIPDKTITTAGLNFDHGDVKRLGMNCTLCHEGVVKGDGEVLPERCYTCHNDAERLGRFAETEFLHRTHVTEHKVECLNCHTEIAHKIPAREEALAAECKSCHTPTAGHSEVRDFYRGISGKNVQPRPAAMYLAGVRCEACHNTPGTEFGRASEVSCMSCHGPKALAVYRGWKASLSRRIEVVKAELKDSKRRLEGKQDGAQGKLIKDAEHNLSLVENARPVHNPGYALDLLDNAYRASLAVAGDGKTARPGWLQAPYESECLQCHFGIEYLTRSVFGREFPHDKHVVSGRLRCAVCHEGRDQHGVTKITTGQDCERCHSRITKPMANLPAEECLACHTADIGKVSEKVRFPHDKHIESGVECALCHVGVDQTAHRAFAKSATALPKLEHATCVTCHSGDVPAGDQAPEGADCAKCHVEF